MSVKQSSKTKNPYGQYFTPSHVANFMISLSSVNSNSIVLEPCCGQGVFLRALENRGINSIVAYEIDPSLSNPDYVINGSFVSADINTQFDLVIGNPPYIRWKNLEDNLKSELEHNRLWNKYCNSLCDYLYIFIIKSILLLKEGGELIFICPEFWMNTTHSAILRNFMIDQGYFTDIISFSESKVFDKVNSSIMIFRYVKGSKGKGNINIVKVRNRVKIDEAMLENIRHQRPSEFIDYFQIEQFKRDSSWIMEKKDLVEDILLIENNCSTTIGSVCDIGNGMVSGLDVAFRITGELNELEQESSIDVIKGKDLNPYYYSTTTRYIFISDSITESELKEKYPHFYSQLLPFKEQLMERYQYNKQFNYWEWVFPRNYKLLSRSEKKIFVPCKERVSNKKYFRFSLVEEGIYSTQDVTALFKKETTKESIEYILAYLNNPRIFNWVLLKGIVKGNVVEFSENPLSRIPFRQINWQNDDEVNIHQEITETTQHIINNQQSTDADQNRLNMLFDKLFSTPCREGKIDGQARLSDFIKIID